MTKIERKWTKIAKNILLGRKITSIRYVNRKEADAFMWYKRPVALHLDNGVWVFPSQDDEGNDGGALFTTDEKQGCLPVLDLND